MKRGGGRVSRNVVCVGKMRLGDGNVVHVEIGSRMNECDGTRFTEIAVEFEGTYKHIT